MQSPLSFFEIFEKDEKNKISPFSGKKTKKNLWRYKIQIFKFILGSIFTNNKRKNTQLYESEKESQSKLSESEFINSKKFKTTSANNSSSKLAMEKKTEISYQISSAFCNEELDELESRLEKMIRKQAAKKGKAKQVQTSQKPSGLTNSDLMDSVDELLLCDSPHFSVEQRGKISSNQLKNLKDEISGLGHEALLPFIEFLSTTPI